MSCSLLVITGPTACGKTSRGVDCAIAFNGEIVSADSRQIYRGMDLGTGKDIDEYGDTPFHMIDIADAGYKYNLFEFLRDANIAINDIKERQKLPIVVGGTGLYIEAILNGLQLPQVPENTFLRSKLQGLSLEELTAILSRMKSLHNTTDVDTTKRAIRAIEIATYYEEHPDAITQTTPHPVADAVTICIDIQREQRRQRITTRLNARLQQGMVEEVENLLRSGIAAEDLIYYGLEYKFLTEYLIGQLSYADMVDKLEIAIHQFAKRQMTWFRGMERRGHKLHYISYDLPSAEFIARVREICKF